MARYRNIDQLLVAKDEDYFSIQHENVDLNNLRFGWKMYLIIPAIVTILNVLIFSFTPVSKWLISKSALFNFLNFNYAFKSLFNYARYDGSYIDFFYLWVFIMIVFFGTLITLLCVDIFLGKDIGRLSINTFTYINNRLFWMLKNDVKGITYNNKGYTTEKKIVDDSEAYQYTGRPSRRKPKPIQPQPEIDLNIEPTQCPNFDLPEFDPDGPNPFAREDK